ncbi:glycine/betaine ABC transporter substrate-binding protein [Meridianimarinicoccus roseus]|uniref:Glycine/betaine ABC transporter substrate-binding protein n=1 Tax=Meridianimarinicoccus roseus TaxID=2072018 RepID=A0A2V2LHU8_9RHOB|nr:glycine betaine ABC transporter substrate-binding protein [Meridianimarinicoccus roseus]PWR03581.1 glycine/betaine ABC transporter substrate-binding protein [Meridianimarinicoccus roseus]
MIFSEVSRRPRQTATAVALLTLGGTAAHADCGEVTITEMDWASSAVVSSVATFLMAQGYGCDVTLVPSSTTPALLSVAETGTPDIVTEMWTNGSTIYDQLLAEGKVTPAADVISDGGQGGWWVPDYLVEQHPELATVEGVLANPDLLGGRFHSCPDGWACKYDTIDLVNAFGMPEAGYEIFEHGSGETLASSIASAVENREPWIGYYWSPTAIVGRYNLVKVDLGPYNAEAYDCALSPDCTGGGTSDYATSPVKTVLTNDFIDREPEIAELMENLSFTNAQMNDVLAWQQTNNASNEEAAVHFLTSYPDVWSGWLNDAARERLAALLQ